MRKFYLLVIFVFCSVAGFAQTGIVTTNLWPNSVCIDGSTSNLGSVNFTPSTFTAGCQISSVTVRIDWAKTGGSCPSNFTSGSSYHAETSFNLQAPDLSQPLAIPGTWTGNTSIANSVITTFSTGASIPPGPGTPVSGTFASNPNNMGNFVGTSALGTWNVTASDALSQNPLIVGYMRLTVNTIADVINPTISDPGNFSVNAANGQCGANVTYSASASDLCGVTDFQRTAGPASGSFFPVGQTTVTHRATDTYGRQTTQSFVVTVVDNQNPSIACPANITLPADPGGCTRNVTYSTPTASDNCPGVTVALISGPASGSAFSVGTTPVTWRATDAASRTSTCTFNVTIQDNQNPGIVCPGNITVNAAAGQCAAPVTYSTPTGSDNCPGFSVARIAGPASGSSFPVGSTTVTHRVTDASSNTAQCSFTVTVVDNQPPTISCPANISVNNTPGQCSAVVSWTAPVGADNCAGATTARIAGPAQGSTFTAEATTTITYQVTDGAGQTAQCSFTVTVEDSEPPVITCPANIVVPNDAGQCNAVVNFSSATFTDNCSGGSVSQTSGLTPNSQFGVNSSPNTVGFTATDAAGNQSSCTFTITVNDTEDPTIACPANIVVDNDPNQCNAVVSWTVPVGADNCPGQSTVRTGPAPGSTFAVQSTTTITYTVTDASGNQAACSFDVTVEDNDFPLVNCPANQNLTFVNCEYDLPDYVAQGLATYSDNCSPLVVVQTPVPTTTITEQTTVQVSVTDPSGNESICAFTITPLDNTPPTFDNCPQAPVQVPVNSSCQFFMPDYSTMAVSDVCNPTLTITQSPGAGTPQSVATNVTVTVSDGTNSTNCVFSVEPLDATAPSIICPQDRVEPANASCQVVLPNYTGLPSVVVSDNCDGGPAVTQPSAGTTITGSGTVTLFATDATGNVGSCSFTVTVQDNTPPTVTCPAAQSASYNANCSYSIVDFTNLVTTSDNCPGSVSLVQSPTAGTSIGASSSQVTITGTDAAGNVSTCQFTLNVLDVTPPSIACPVAQQVNVDGNCEYDLGNFVSLATTSDNCSSVTVTQSPAVGTTYDQTVDPSVTVTLTATDVDLNTNSCTFQVLLNDVTPPSITCNADLNVLFNSNCQFVVGNRTSHYSALSDNCTTSPVVTQSPSSSTVIQGQTTVTLTATDASGNMGTCTFQIIPSDSQAPTVVTCPQAPISINYDASCNYTLADYTGNTAFTDNCDQSLAITQSPGFGTVIGSQAPTNVTITATDDAGNSNFCTITISPVDVTPPSLVCPSDQLEDFDSGCEFTLLDYRSLATATDNCTNPVTVTQFLGAGAVITGSTSILITATDGAGNSGQCTFNVVPDDNTPPTITCPADQTVAFNSQCAYNMTDMTGLATGVADNCAGGVTVTQSVSVGTSLGANTAVILTATDASGNTANCTFNVLPTDQTAPTISCPQNQVVNVDAGCLYDLLNYTGQAVASDFCDPTVTVTQSPSPTTGISLATVTTVTLTATDDAANTAQCSFTVSAVDNSAPTISCPSDTVVSTDANCQYVLIDETDNHELVINDNCDASPTVTQSPAAGTILTANTTVTLTVEDASGNTGSCSYLFTVEDQVDPTIICPPDLEVSSNSSCQFVVPDYTSSGSVDDNCDPILTVTQSPAIGSSFSGSQVVTLTVVDDDNNSSTCTFTITENDDTDPTITCPGDQLVNFNGDCEYLLLDYTGLAVATDNCGSPTVTQDLVVGTVISTTTTVELTATDADLNEVSCTFDVIPSDIGAPTVSCLQPSITVATGANCSFTLGTYTGAAFASATDNCSSSFSFTQSPVAGSLIGGSTVVTISTSDAAGNIGSCTMTVNPEDNTAPVLFCPANVTVALDADCEFDVPDYTSLVFVSDNCDSSPFTITQSPASGFTITGEDATTVSFSVTDAGGNTGTCSFTLTTEDNQAPTITCPASTTVSANTNCEFTLADYTGNVTSGDNCSVPTLVQSPAANADYSGPQVVTIVATDDAGNTNSCSFTVTPVDDTPPSVTCPANQTPNFTSNCEFTIIDYTSLSTFSDFCDNTPFVTQSPGVGTIVSGNTTVTVAVTDDAGNSTLCTFEVDPVDNQVPVITCPSPFTEDLSANCDFNIVDYTSLVTVTDNCDNNPTIVQSPASGLVSPPSVPITMTAIDASGNSATCTFNLLLEDNTLPVLTNCPQDQTVPLSANCQFIVANYTTIPTVTDNCDPSAAVTQSPLAGSLIGGATVVTISATDDDGNVGTCSFTVTPEDVNPPTIFDCPTNITTSNDLGICGAEVTYNTITALDNCAGVVVPITTGQASGTIFPVGATVVTYVADDGNGNTSSCIFTVTVNDTEDPIIICPSNITVNVDPTTCGADVTYSLPTVTDNCTNPITPTLDGGLASGSNFAVGINTVTYGAEDDYGNTSSCSFTVTVVDNEPPVIVCPANITVGNDPGDCSATVSYLLPTVSDNCTNGIAPSLTAGVASGGTFVFGTTTVSYEAEDASGNTADCSFTVTVNDTEDPVLTCPNDTSISCDATVAYDDPTVSDNCTSGIVPVQVSPAIGFSFPDGPTVVTFEGDDGNGNIGSCSFTVTVIDTTAPAISCPGDQTEFFNALCQLAIPDYTGLATTTDNCDAGPVVTQSPTPDSTITGTTTVTLTSTDYSGNSASCTFVVSDETPPAITCPNNQTVGSNINCQFSLPNYALQTVSSDNCGPVTLSQSPAVGTVISTLTTVTMTSLDAFGNTSSCQFTVTLVDNIAPSITCIGNQQAVFDANCMFQLPNYTGQASAQDNCDVSPDITQSPAPGSMIGGTTQVTFTATDDSNNSTSCTFTVTPIDNTAPTIVCPATQVAEFDANCGYALGDYTSLATTADNCSSSITVTQSPAIGSPQTLSTIVTLTANDGNGGTSSCSFVVVPEDNVDPVIVCPADFEVDYDANCEYTVADFTGLGTTSDNCSTSLTVTQSPSVGAVVSTTTAVTLTVDDGNGNTSNCTFNIDPVDNTGPTIICANDQFVPFDENCEFEVADYNGFAQTSDNCSSTIIVTQSPAAGTIFTGAGTVTLTANDGNGNSSSCSFGVIPFDDTEPSIICPDDQEVSFNANCAFVITDYASLAVVDDNCSTNIPVDQDVTVGTSIFATTTVTLTAGDGNGNFESCSFDVIPSDDTDPVATCPASFTVSLSPDCDFVLPDYTSLVLGTDNCGNATIVLSETAGTVITSATEITATVEDEAGNSVTCSFIVTPEDDEVPVITCPNNQDVSLDANCQVVMPDYSALTFASDNCTSPLVMDQFPPAGTVILTNTIVTMSVEDDGGNEVSCTFAVLPEDDTPPVIAQCPGDQTVLVGQNCTVAMPDFSSLIQGTDNCDISLQYGQQPLAGSNVGGPGVYPVGIGFGDDNGNVAFCQFDLIVSDEVDPVVTCPADQLIGLNANCQFAVPDFTALSSASDACGSVILTQSPLAGSVITGQLNATVIAEDESGNTATCTFFVDVVPMVVSVTGTDVTCNNGNDGTATISVTGGNPPYTPDWGGFNPNALAQGTYSVTVSDANGCTAVGSVTIGDGATFEIEVDPSGDVQICQGESVVLNAGSGYAVYNWSTGASVQSITVSNEASYWVTVTNADGCVSNTDTVTVSFYDPIVPTITVGGDGVLYCSNDTALTYQWYLNGTAISGADEAWYCPLVSGNYYVRITDSYGCQISSLTEEYTYDENSQCATGIEEHGLSMDIYPNPSSGVFTVNYSLEYQTEMKLIVFDLMGKQITNEVQITTLAGSTILDLSGEADGVYMLRVQLGNERLLQQRLVLVK